MGGGSVYVVGKAVLYFIMFMIVLNFILTASHSATLQCKCDESSTPLPPVSKRYKYWIVDKSKPKLPNYKRYVLYGQEGGFNNQWIELQHAIYIALLLNRTLIIPVKAGQKVHKARDSNMASYFDFDDLGRGVSFIHKANLTADDWDKLYNSETINELSWGRAPNSTVFTDYVEGAPKTTKTLFGLLDNYKNSTRKLLRFPHLWGTRDFFTLPPIVEEKLLFITNNYLHYRDDIFVKALRIVDQLGDDYAAAHIRATDMQVWWKLKHSLYMPHMVSKSTKIYIATDALYLGKGGAAEELVDIYGRQQLYSWSNFSHLFNDSLEELKDNDYQGVLEQIVCVLAKQFFGTPGSTFSSKIVKMRSLYSPSFMHSHYDSYP